MFVLTKDSKYYNFDEDLWVDDYKQATELVDKDSKKDGSNYRWVIVQTYCPGPLTVVLDKQTGTQREMPCILDASSRIEYELSDRENKKKREQRKEKEARIIELSKLIKSQKEESPKAQELASLVLSLTSPENLVE